MGTYKGRVRVERLWRVTGRRRPTLLVLLDDGSVAVGDRLIAPDPPGGAADVVAVEMPPRHADRSLRRFGLVVTPGLGKAASPGQTLVVEARDKLLSRQAPKDEV